MIQKDEDRCTPVDVAVISSLATVEPSVAFEFEVDGDEAVGVDVGMLDSFLIVSFDGDESGEMLG